MAWLLPLTVMTTWRVSEMNVLRRLVERGFTFAVNGDVLQVKPASRIDEDLSAYITNHKPILLHLAKAWSDLDQSIHEFCDARGESAEHGAALLADCWKEPASDWAWWTAYFAAWTRGQYIERDDPNWPVGHVARRAHHTSWPPRHDRDSDCGW